MSAPEGGIFILHIYNTGSNILPCTEHVKITQFIWVIFRYLIAGSNLCYYFLMRSEIISKKLQKIKNVIDINYLIHETEDAGQIKDYYKTNKLAYRVFHNWQGYLHMGISHDNQYRKSDLLTQVKEIQNHITDTTKNILEIGCGRGSNTFYLANKNPNIHFSAIDLSTTPIKQLKNISFKMADYHNLSMFKDKSFDIVFGIETLCHSDDKIKVLKEIYRVLKPNGTFIIYDGYFNKNENEMTEDEKVSSTLITKGMAVNKFEQLSSFEKYLIDVSFLVKEKTDLSENIKPSLLRFEKMANRFFKFKTIGKTFKFVLPEKVVRNSISGYLMIDLINNRTFVYYKHVLKKNSLS